MKKEKKQKCRASIARLSVSEPNRERKLKNKNLEREKARRDFIRQIETKKDTGYRRGCLSLNKGKSPERDLSPGTCLVRMFITDLIKKVFVTSVMNTRYGLGERIRTSGLLNPIQARYQTAPHPDAYAQAICYHLRVKMSTKKPMRKAGDFSGES